MTTALRRFLATAWYRFTSPSYRMLEKSGLFDPAFYLANNPDVASSGADPLVHYLTKGFAELRQPGPLFDAGFYLQQVPSLAEKGENPLLHFLRQGRYRGLTAHPLFDVEHYTRQNPGTDFAVQDPLSHFLQTNGKPISPSPYFDPAFYCGRYSDAAGFADDPLSAYKHYLRVGQKQKRQPGIFFDTGWYLDRTPVLHELGMDPISHYYLFGIREKKSPSPLFDPEYYGTTCEVRPDGDLFAHYLRHEASANFRPCSWFDPLFYRQQYLAGAPGQESPLKHYLRYGRQEQFYPNREVADLVEKPLISVVVPVYNVAPAHLNNCIRSVLYQSYPHWELCLADDCSTDPGIRPLLERWAESERRIKVVFLPENSGISAATNAAAAVAAGSYLAFLDNDDELDPNALFSFARAIGRLAADLLYSDEDLIGADGTRFSVFRKPDFNRELLLCHNYITHCVVASTSLHEKVGGCAGELNGAQDLDLFLKLSEQAERIIHLPEILYHWRASETSTSINHSQKSYADEAGRKSVANALARQGIGATVDFTELKFFYRARREVQSGLSVTLLVYWQRPIDDFDNWLVRLIGTAGHEIMQLVMAVDAQELVEPARLAGLKAGIDTVCFAVSGALGPASAYNDATASIRGDFVAIADSLLESTGDGWLAALLEYCGQYEIGMVGGRSDLSAEQPEVTPIPDCSIASPAYYARFLTSCSVLMNGLHCPQEVRSVDGALCLIRTALLRDSGGFDHNDFPLLFFIHDLCFRLHRQGKIHIYTPYCTSTRHAASGVDTDHREQPALQQEKLRFQKRWHDLLGQGDPFYNTGLLKDRQQSTDQFRSWLIGIPAPSTLTST
jgi:glycosyltransferase involved in cell wall biosynthesis